MPETDFFLDSADERTFVSFILERGGWLVAGRQKSAGYERIDTWHAYETARVGGGGKWALENERLFFVLFDSYDECPLELRAVNGGYYKGAYYISQRVRGPTIDLSTCVQYHKLGSRQISSGFLGYYPSYQNTVTGEMEQTPKALIDQYRAIVKQLKKEGVVIKAHTGRKYVIGPHTYPRVKSGELTLGVQGLELPSDS